MKLSELRAEARGRLDDRAPPYLWTVEDLDRYLNSAVEEAAIRARLIYDERTPRVVEIALREGVAEYPLAAEVIRVDYAVLQSTGRQIERIKDRDLRAWDGEWSTAAGTVTAFHEREQSIRIYRIPQAVDVVKLALWRLPLCKLKTDDDEPEIPRREHIKLIDWVCREAFLKRDSDAFDENRAATFAALFTASFGPRESADVYRKRRLRGATVVKATW